MTAEATTLLGLLADDDRLRVVAALALGASTPAEVAAATGLDIPRAGKALARLATGGLVEADKHHHRLLTARFREALDGIERPAASEVPDSGLGPDADRVLRTFLRDGRLTQIPTARAKRLVVLDYLAALFEPGETYSEAEVNDKLAAFHPDVAALRRYLVDEDYLHRRDSIYWRSGGSYPV